ncbi:MAG TPA: winged helix-turn-helix domain-containing protein [Terriglobales bacterium]|nr:winged helix-turn-helix domain-containing protein [Terriglobales bacterium]
MVFDDQTRVFRFGVFEVDLRSRQLRKLGRVVPLQNQAFQLLLALLQRAGELVTRDNIHRALWPADLYVNFDHGMNNAVNRLRAALEDPARESRFIENVPRMGYRFIATVERPTVRANHSASTHHVNDKARELYLKGRYCWNRRTPDALARALKFFKLAIQKAPDYAQAYAGLADSYLLLGTWGHEALAPVEAYPQAKAAAMHALGLDPNLGEAHASLAISLVACDWNFQAADEHYRHALELDPGYATGRQWYALHLCDLGKYDEAIVEMQTAERLDPLSLVIGTDLAHTFLVAGLYMRSLLQCRKVLELDPTFAAAHFQIGEAYLKMHMYGGAAEEFRRAMDLSGGNTKFKSNLAHLFGVVGKKQQALNILKEFEARSKRDFLHSASVSSIYTGLDENDKAIAWLEDAYQQRCDPEILQWPTFDNLRSDPRFRDIMHRIGVPS